MPLPPSSTTFAGLIALVSMNSQRRVLELGVDVDLLGRPPLAWRLREALRASSAAISPIPLSPLSATAPRSTSFAPVYAFGLCEAVHISPPSRSREPTR